MKKFVACVAAAIVGFGAYGPPAAATGSDPSERQPRIYGGVPSADPHIVNLGLKVGGEVVGVCTAGIWKPRLLMTAAHCTEGISEFLIGAPGAPSLALDQTGAVVGAVDVQVLQVFQPPTYKEDGSNNVKPDDIALILLDRDIGGAPFARLANELDLVTPWASKGPVNHAGYGLINDNQLPDVPREVSLPFQYFYPSSSLGVTFATAQNPASGICSGDSGSPAYLRTAGGDLLIGPVVGGAGPCGGGAPASKYRNVGTFAMGYVDLQNQALVQAGYSPIPGAPVGLALTPVNSTVVLKWSPPQDFAEHVVRYDILNSTGEALCSTTSLECSVPDLADGSYTFTVQAVNAQGEGRLVPMASVERVEIAKPPKMAAPKVIQKGGKRTVQFSSIVNETSAVVNSYAITDKTGKTVCTVKESGKSKYSCSNKKIRNSSQRYRVQAQTEMGLSPVSSLSSKG